MQAIPYAEAVARKFRLERAPTLLAQREAVTPIAFTRLRGEGSFRGRTMGAPPEEAFSLHVALAPMQASDIWIDGQYSKLPAASVGDTFVVNLEANPIARLNPPYDLLRFYLSSATLDQLAYDRGVRRVGRLRTTAVGAQDPVMRGLALAVLPVLEEPNMGTALFLDAIALAFHAHVVHHYGGAPESSGSVRVGLAPWQLRRVDAYIEAHLDGAPSISDLAAECRLSPTHFARSFRQATGMPPHRWLTKRRIGRAKELLLGGQHELAQIALDCGFADQSHFTRVFVQSEGQSPGKWRRVRYN
jgi:AraC family transcriptional regulator